MFGTFNAMKRLAILLAISLSACAAPSSRGDLSRAVAQCDEAGSRSSEQSREDFPNRETAINEHRELRAELGEPIPDAPTMIFLHAAGGHLATSEYSIVVHRSADGQWNGTAVGRSKIWIEDASFQPMKRRDWVIGAEAAKRLDQILGDGCFYAEPTTFDGEGGPPNRGAMFVRVDVITPTRQRSARYLSDYAKGLTAEVDRLVRPQ